MYAPWGVFSSTLLHPLTKANQVPCIGPQRWDEDHVHQPEGVEHLHAHPSEGAEKGIVEYGPYPNANTLPSSVGQDPGKEEEQTEDGQGHG